MTRQLASATTCLPQRGLDRIDKLILKGLQSDGRKPISELAREVHLTTSPCLDRVRRLEESGYIRGYAAVLDPKRLGAGLLAFAEVNIDRTNPDSFELFRAAVANLEEVIECHMIAGGVDYLLKIRLADMEAYRIFLGKGLITLPGVTRTRTYVVMEEVKATVHFKF
jgi:Lrp/AsnC family transcriptional regulator, leucine-responsive regulatory protein